MERQLFSSREIIPLGHISSFPTYSGQRDYKGWASSEVTMGRYAQLHTHEQPSHGECTYTCIVHMGNKSYVNTNLINISARHYAQLHNL
jgi:hypothetical protein